MTLQQGCPRPGAGGELGKCVVLTTRQHQHVNEAACVLMAGGRTEKIGSYDEWVAGSKGKLTTHVADDSVLMSCPRSNQRKQSRSLSLGRKSWTRRSFQEWSAWTPACVDWAKAVGGAWVAVLLLLLFCITQPGICSCDNHHHRKVDQKTGRRAPGW
jgi:hypothetical protein